MPRGIGQGRPGKLPAHIVGIFGLALAVAMLTGCAELPWGRTEDFRAFIEVTSCVQNAPPVPLESRKFYQVLSARPFVNDPCRGAICSPLSPEQSDDRSYLVNFINEQGVPTWSKLWVIDRRNIIDSNPARSLDLPSGRPPGLVPPPPSHAGETCANLVVVPWQKDRNRPFWVADATLLLNPKSLDENASQAANILLGLFALLLVGILFVRAGYFDSPPSERKGGVALSAGIMIVGCVLLWIVFGEWVAGPIDPLRKIQSFYEFYGRMPKVNGHLLPFSGQAARTLFSGPLVVTNFSQPIDGFRYIAIGTLALWLLVFYKRLYMGWHYLFVSHPASPFIIPSLRNKTPIDTRGLKRTICEGADDSGSRSKTYYENQEAKSRVLKKKLEEDAAIMEATIRRERALAGLEDAERELREAKQRSEKKR